jgi:hypothetical protein
MKFNICFANLSRPNFQPIHMLSMLSVIGDGVRFLTRALEEAGHSVTLSPQNVYKDAINIFWERFYNFDDGLDFPAQLRREGFRFGMICTEPMTTPGAYNPFEFEPVSARIIYDQYAHTASLADFVWYLLEEAGPACRSFNPKSYFLPFGHVAGYAELDDPAARATSADFLLQGFMTPRRNELAGTLSSNGFRVVASHFQPDYVRLNQMASTRIALSPQKTTNHSIFSYSRIYHAIMNRVPMIVEYDGPATYMSPYCLTARPTEFLTTCAAFARRTDLAILAQRNYDRLAAELPMRPIIDKLVSESL